MSNDIENIKLHQEFVEKDVIKIKFTMYKIQAGLILLGLISGISAVISIFNFMQLQTILNSLGAK